MSRSNLSLQTCSIARAVSQMGDEWTFMILRELFLGTRRFDDFQRLTGMSSHLLSKRLRKLESHRVIRRNAYSDHPPRYEYRLTEKGRDLWPVIIALKQWGDKWLTEGAPPVQIRHKKCGHLTNPGMTCSECGEAMSALDASAQLSQPFIIERETLTRSA